MRLIDADVCEKKLQHDWMNNRMGFGKWYDIKQFLNEAPTIDAVVVVRCKDCEYYNGEDKYCVNDIFAKPDGYCMFGRKER